MGKRGGRAVVGRSRACVRLEDEQSKARSGAGPNLQFGQFLQLSYQKSKRQGGQRPDARGVWGAGHTDRRAALRTAPTAALVGGTATAWKSAKIGHFCCANKPWCGTPNNSDLARGGGRVFFAVVQCGVLLRVFDNQPEPWPLQNIVSLKGFCARTNHILRKHPSVWASHSPPVSPTRLLRKILYLPNPPVLQYISYNIGNDNIL